MRGVPRARPAISRRAVGRERQAQHAGAALDDGEQLLGGIEVEPHRDAEAVAQRRGDQARARRGADSVNGLSVILTERADGPSPITRSSS